VQVFAHVHKNDNTIF